ncbi:MAG: ABC transporter ATP-binding protein/permease [Lactobacillus sp.]|jgi:ATP-binding cassette subfamily C protein|nr:ABC transporter ATP-binding protein/permease [Lactobacillus sp.]
MRLLLRLLGYAKNLNWILLASILAGTVTTLCQLALLWLGFAALVDFGALQHLGLAVFGLALAIGLTRFGEQYLGHLVAFKILAGFRDTVYRKITKLAPAKLDEKHGSDLLKLIAQDIEQIEIFYAHTLAPVAIAGIVSIIQVIWFWSLAPVWGISALVSYALVGVLLPFLNQKEVAPQTQALTQADSQQQRLETESVQGKFELQQFQTVPTQLAKLTRANRHYWHLSQIKTALQDKQNIAMQVLLILCFLNFAVAGLIGHLSLVPILLFPFTFGRVLALAALPGSLSGGILAAKHLFALLDETPVVQDAPEAKPLAAPLTDFDMTHIDFAYPTKPNNQILADLNFQGKAPKRIGLVGPSGVGKSTIVKLLMTWYAPNAGQITVNGTPSISVLLASLRQAINYMPQNPKIFTGTIRTNLTLGEKSFSDQRLLEVLGWVELAETVLQFPKGLDTPISDSARHFSAGETQRLDLARALLHPSQILVLDEPTSNLDVLNEALVLRAVQQHYAGLVIMVTHRQSSLAICDEVWQFADQQLQQIK